MNNPHEELINELGELIGSTTPPYWLIHTDVLSRTIGALKSQPFDPIQQIIDGGEIVNPRGDRFKIGESTGSALIKAYNSNFWKSLGYGTYTLIESLSHGSFKPYHEPPAEGTREWAKGLDAKVRYSTWSSGYWVNFVTGECKAYTGPENSLWNDQIYDTGWSLFVEPREDGYYSVIASENDEVVIACWYGNRWILNASSFDDVDFHWISDKLIKPDAPDKKETLGSILTEALNDIGKSS